MSDHGSRLPTRTLTRGALDVLVLAGDGDPHERIATRALLLAVFEVGPLRVLRWAWIASSGLAYALVVAGILGLLPG
jgi:hypothetical protein